MVIGLQLKQDPEIYVSRTIAVLERATEDRENAGSS